MEIKHIKTSDFLPFSDNCYNEYVPIIVNISKVKSEKDIQYIKENEENIKKEEQNYESYKKHMLEYYRKVVTQNIDFKKIIYRIKYIGNGNVEPHVYCKKDDILCKIRTNSNYKNNKIYFEENKKRKSEEDKTSIKYKDYKYDTIIVNDILIFRFFVFKSKYFFENQNQGFYEVFRVCFKDKNVWGEGRDETYNFNLNYIEHFGKLSNYNKYKYFRNDKDLSKDIYNMYPFLYKNIDELDCWALPSFMDFSSKFNSAYKQEKIFNNTPNIIKQDLKKQHKILKKMVKDSNSNIMIRTISNLDYILFIVYKFGKEIERLYFTKNKLYAFGYNEFDKCWASIRNKNFIGHYANNKNFYYDKKFSKELLDNTILHKCIFDTNNYTYPLRTMKMQLDYLFVEQASRYGFNKFVNDMSYNYIGETLHFLHEFANFGKLSSLKNIQLHELFGISKGQLKLINKNLSTEKLAYVLKEINSKKAKKKFPNDEIRFKITQLCLDCSPSKINKIVKKFEENEKDYNKFFKHLLEKDEPITLINHYIDYLSFIPLANRYGAFHYKEIIAPSDINFLHDRAYRDFCYEKEKNPKKKGLSTEIKLQNFVETEEYTKFLFNDDSYTILPIKKGIDLIEEGKNLSHCVGGYRHHVANKRSYIYFLRKSKQKEKALYTLEVKKRIVTTKEKGKKVKKEIYYLNQCYGYKDSYIQEESCKKFVQNWCKKNKIEIKCVV